MRKLLFVHDEQHLELAIRNVQDFLDFEQRLTKGDAASDLLAVLLVCPDVVHELLLSEQECALRPSADGSPLFGSDSVSVNDIWTLVTLSHQNFQEPRTRHEALDRVLDILRTQGFVRDAATVFRISPSEEPHLLICEQMHFLKTEHP